MSDEANRDQQPRCSFCRRDPPVPGKIIAGPEAYICEECVATAVDIIRSDKGEAGADWPGPSSGREG